jgi:hypothetical protein
MSIEVYARSVNESDSSHLATVANVSELRELIDHMRNVGVDCEGDTYREFATQYVVDKEDAYFEIVIG